MPKPDRGETQEHYISRFMSSSEAQRDYPDQQQRLAVAYSYWRKHSNKKESSLPFEFKEIDGKLIVKGYIATTHLDSGFWDHERDVYIRDTIKKETLEQWAEDINSGNPRSNKVSVNHERQPHVAGVGLKGSARVDKLPDGNYGLWVETLVDKTRSDYSETKYRIDNNLLDSFSIEFTTKDPVTGEYISNAVKEHSYGEGIIRELMPSTQLEGWTLASQPMNEYAVMVKELFDKGIFKANKEVTKLVEEDMKEAYEEESEESEESPKKPAKKGVKPAHMNTSTGVPGEETSNPYYGKMPSSGKESFSAEDLAILREAKEKRMQKAIIDSVKEAMKSEVKEALKEVKIQTKVGTGITETAEKKEITEFKELFNNTSYSLKEMARVAGAYIDAFGGLKSTKTVEQRIASNGFKVRYKEVPMSKENPSRAIEFKGLGITTNQNTDTDYLLSAAELQDSFDPVIYNALNQQTVTWNILNKDDFSNKGNNQVQFILKTAINSSGGFYEGNAVTTGNVTRLKLQTKFKKCMKGVEVDGDMIAAARGGPIGDVFAQEVMDTTIDLLQIMNQSLFGVATAGSTTITNNDAGTGAAGLETDKSVICFRYLTDSATYTTLYNLTRSTANKLAPDTATDTYINQSSTRINLSNLRKAKRQALKDGSMIQNLVFVTNHTQGDLYRGIYDSIQRTAPTSTRFGFEGRPEFDGIPIFEDKDCPEASWYLIDLDSTRVAIWVPPTLEMLGKDADSQKGFIKCYWALYCRNPRRIVEIYGCATS